jgi:ribonuclease R
MAKEVSVSSKTRKKLRSALWSFLQSDDYQPVEQLTLFKSCSIPKKYHAVCKELITELITQDMLSIKNHLLYPERPPKEQLVTGRISIHPKGFGFVTADDLELYPKDIFIPKPHMNHAIDKDLVEIKIIASKKQDKGPEGIVLNILKRSRDSLVGIIREASAQELIAYCPLLGENKIVYVTPSKQLPLKEGDRVILHINDWSTYPSRICTTPFQLLGSIMDASKDIDAAIYEYGIRQDFSEATIEEAKRFPKNPTKQDLKNRLDLTHIETFTIDPDTAKDFDDALSLSQDDSGDYHLIVHIADVSYYVPSNSLLDREAFERSNSTYFPNRCVPMLPEELSNGLCSLKENVVRLTVSVFMRFDPEGTLKAYDIRRSYIQSQKRFTYQGAKQILDEIIQSPHSSTLHLMTKLCKLLQKKRYERGSVDLSLPEVILKIDENGEPTGFEVSEYDITHQLVEEFMLKANETVAHSLLSRNISAIFRVHESPASSDTEDFATLARAFGFKLKKSPNKKDLQELFETAKTSPYLHQLSVAFIRSMKLAIYSEHNVGHFGLSLEHYCHFTSPIRRYSDLIIHRLLFETHLPVEELKKISLHCSDKERVSFRAEHSVLLLKKLRFLQTEFQKDPQRIYEAVVSKIKPFGLYFELSPLMFEGFIHISAIGEDYYIYQDKNNRLIGESSGESFSSGTLMHVKLLSLNLISQETLWEIVRKKKASRKKKPR